MSAILPPGGSVAVIAHGTPIWLQDRPWSVALREFLTDQFGLTAPGRAAPTSQPGVDTRTS